MRNSIKNQVEEAVSNNVVDYFADLITSSDFVERHIRTILTLSEEQEEKIRDILAEYNMDWNSADCDAEGPTQEQDEELNKIINDCAKAIADNVQDVDNWTESGEDERTHKLYKLTVWQRYSGIYTRHFASEDEARYHVNSDYSEELPENKYPGDGTDHTEITEFVLTGPKPKNEAEIEEAWSSDYSEITRSIYFVKSEN